MSDNVLKEINTLSMSIDRKFLEIARILRKMKEEDPVSFRAVPDTTPIGRRKSFALVRIDKVFGGRGLPEERLVNIGWAKLNAIAPFVTPMTCEPLLQLAESHKFLDLERILRGQTPIPDGRVVLLEFAPAEYSAFAGTLLAYGAVRSGKGLFRKEQALLAAFADLKAKSGAADL